MAQTLFVNSDRTFRKEIMIHEKANYDMGKIPDDEPVFLLRGTDTDAANLVRIWVLLKEGRLTDEKKASVLAHADEMDKCVWRNMGGFGCSQSQPYPTKQRD